MAEVVAGLLTSGIVKIAVDKLSSALKEQANLAWNFNDNLEDMKNTMESMAAVFKDAEKQSVKNESARLWLKRLKHAALRISDMMDDYQDTTTEMSGMVSYLTAPAKNMVLANKMKNMREELRKINKEHQDFHFTPASQDQPPCDDRETKSDVNKEEIILGRDAEKKEIMDILSANHSKDGAMFLPIYGLGGMGKSTLARLVYNDTRFKHYYDLLPVWVYVSQELDLKKIGRSIILQLPTTGGPQNTDTLQLIQQCLDDQLRGKKILIVLDDIWEEDEFKLTELKGMLNKNGNMVDVLVTTREESIANKICTNRAYMLQPLKDNVCWEIIKRYSGFEHKSNQVKLEEIGLDITKKCVGVALAAQALGYMLKPEDQDGWAEINNSDIWNESQHNKVLPSLMLSYERMAPILRLCFSYCAIFPKGHDICEDDLVHQWVALDFIKNPSEGKKYIKHLLGMSFLQYSKLPTTPTKNVMLYTMHDLVHDLARSVVGDELIVIDAAKKGKTSVQKYYRYALLINYVGQTKLSNILSKKVRSLHFSSSSKVGPRDHSFSFAKRLSILDFSECSSIPLPPSIGQLKQLKCLIAPKLQNTSLPEAIAELSKLQYLNLCGSSLISTLPESISKLSCLMHLDLSGCSGISKVSESFGGLKSLVHLDMSNCFGITSLVGSIGNLEKLRYLDLSGCYGILEVSESFDGLKSLVHLDMSYCSGITSLPGSLGNLKKLRHLDLSRCSGVKDVPDSLTCLKELQYLNLSHSSITRLPEDIGSLTNLQYLSLKWCDKITELAMSLQNLQNLVHLDLSRCTCVEGSLEALRGLTSLGYLDMSRFTWNALPECIGNLKNLRALKLKFCMNLGSLPEWIGNLTNLHTLVLRGCLDLKSLPECIGNLTNLHTLDLKRCWDLKSLPECIGNLKNLHTLDLSGCSKLRSLPDSIGEITVLKSILIEGCSNELIDQVNSKLHCSLALPNFWVRVDVVSGCSNLPLLESINVGELRILCLENVRSMEEACKVKLLDKDKLSDLTLAWSDLDVADRFVDDEDLLRQLEPPRGLESLCLEGYSRQTFPRWFMDISHHLPNLVSIVLKTVTIHDYLPPLGQLPNLAKLRLKNCYRVTKIDKDFCGGKGAFPRLSYFKLDHMYGLEEWSTTYSFEDGDVEEFMFPMLDELYIDHCQRLRLKPCAPICGRWTIEWSDQVISSLEKLDNNIGHLTCSTPTTKMEINSNSQTLGLFHHFPALKKLKLSYCQDLTGLPDCMQHLVSLRSLYLRQCINISALPEWLGELSSLESLTIWWCTGITSFPPSIQQLTKLQTLKIVSNVKLKRWCESKDSKKKLVGIKNIIYEECEESDWLVGDLCPV